MKYTVKEIFYTLQGEGAQSGRAAVFCRFAGCNLWNGREEDRSKAVCKFCDTDFVGGTRFGCAEAVASAVQMHWPSASHGHRYVVCTGGEPLLQLNAALVEAFHAYGFEVAVETNGTLPVPTGVDWVCVSPKAGANLIATSGDELKLVFPQAGIDPAALERLHFEHFFLQPMDGPRLREHTAAAVKYCRARPRWRLSLQMHKVVGIP